MNKETMELELVLYSIPSFLIVHVRGSSKVHPPNFKGLEQHGKHWSRHCGLAVASRLVVQPSEVIDHVLA